MAEPATKSNTSQKDMEGIKADAAVVENTPIIPPGLYIDPSRRDVIERKLKRKIDARCTIFLLIYMMNYLDRNNIGAARLQGLQDDLKLNNTQYATCLSILNVGYILMQVPSNMFINRIARPSIYISIVMVLWGIVSTLTGNVQNFSQMVAVRFLLGFVEAAFLPGALHILSRWYTRKELTKRNAALFCGNLISNAFSSLLAAGILGNMNGTLGHAGWRWLFWIEGAVTIAIAIVAVFILPDLPRNARGFTEEERIVAQLRMLEDVGVADKDEEGDTAMAGLVMILKDTRVYVMMLSFAAYIVGLSFNVYFPTLTATLGYDKIPTLLLSAPPWVFACIAALFVSWHSDKTQEKIWHIYGPMAVGLTGFIICMSTPNTAARYVALFMQTSAYAGYVVFYSWISSSFPRPPAKRAVAFALINAFAQLGSVAGAYVWNFPEHGFRKSYGIVTAMFGFAIVGFWVFRMMLVRMNKELEREEAEQAAEARKASGADAKLTEEEAEVLRLREGFRYLV